jgi:NAD(P)H-dependent flavin oxidoreductase YrpB (nitropropane dioxygenase family)
VLLLEELGLEHPIVQAGMGGGIATAKLAGAVSAAGGLGTVGILAPSRFEAELRQARERARGRAVAANLLVPFSTRAHVEACRKARVEAVVLHAGFDRGLLQQLAADGALVLQTVGTAEEARRALCEGASGVIVQGIEAGGHLVGVERALDALPPVLAVAGGAPVLLAGGIADREDVRLALNAGAAAVVAGTRFLLTHECSAHPAYKRRVLGATRTIETRLFGLGWPSRHRVVPNGATDRWCRSDPRGPRPVRIVHSLSTPLARLPMSMTAALTSTQRVGMPLFGPGPAVKGMPEQMIDTTPLYAGESALRITSVIPAADAVLLLSGTLAAAAANRTRRAAAAVNDLAGSRTIRS